MFQALNECLSQVGGGLFAGGDDQGQFDYFGLELG
jgi:hypothetical protein